MTSVSHISRQLLIFIGASISALIMFSASTASAQAGGAGYYRAELASPVEKSTKIIRGVVWQCEGTSCTGAKGASRPINECVRLARQIGQVTAFSVQSQAMGEDDIAKCNK